MAIAQVNVGSWLLRVVAWDGLLPAFVALVPTMICALLPNNRGVIEIAAVVLPIAAFFIRVSVGTRHIASNTCGTIVRRLQCFVFIVGIIILALIDSVLILTHVMPKGTPFATSSDCIVWMVLVLVYLTSMTVAMYPGRTKSLRYEISS
jgi:hypothetical protein